VYDLYSVPKLDESTSVKFDYFSEHNTGSMVVVQDLSFVVHIRSYLSLVRFNNYIFMQQFWTLS
jgi:hypothetical protein